MTKRTPAGRAQSTQTHTHASHDVDRRNESVQSYSLLRVIRHAQERSVDAGPLRCCAIRLISSRSPRRFCQLSCTVESPCLDHHVARGMFGPCPDVLCMSAGIAKKSFPARSPGRHWRLNGTLMGITNDVAPLGTSCCAALLFFSRLCLVGALVSSGRLGSGGRGSELEYATWSDIRGAGVVAGPVKAPAHTRLFAGGAVGGGRGRNAKRPSRLHSVLHRPAMCDASAGP